MLVVHVAFYGFVSSLSTEIVIAEFGVGAVILVAAWTVVIGVRNQELLPIERFLQLLYSRRFHGFRVSNASIAWGCSLLALSSARRRPLWAGHFEFRQFGCLGSLRVCHACHGFYDS